MTNNSFKDQIKEDIKMIQDELVKYNPLLKKEEYAFNYWVLSKLYNMDIEIIEENVVEYKDLGVDCYVYFEDSKDLYIIQNKYYDSSTPLSKEYIQNDFFLRPINSLQQGTYNKSQELQDIFNKNKNDKDFRIHLCLYVSNDYRDKNIVRMFEQYNPSCQLECYIDAQIFYLEDIKEVYFGERKEEHKNFKCDILTINDGTVLNINPKDYDLPNLVEAKYILTPVSVIYRIMQKAKDKNYSLFEENIREYLGNKGIINAAIARTLENEDERGNFFYYNNGITIICDKITKENSNNSTKFNRRFTVDNPQVVNGCQTTNSIYTVLKKFNEDEIDNKFKDTFIMVKLLVLDPEKESNLYQDIVKYNNSQNAIKEKDFASNTKMFKSLQEEIKQRGLLLIVKQSDKNTFKEKYKFNNFRPKLTDYENIFGLEFEKLNDIMIPLEKFLQVILAFDQGGYYAYTKKTSLLKRDSSINIDVTNFIKNKGYTIDDLLKLYLLFLKAEKDKKASDDNRTPIPHYVLGFLGNRFRNVNEEKRKKAMAYIFGDKQNLDAIYKCYSQVTKYYRIQYLKTKDIEYNKMIKTPIDDTIVETGYEISKAMLEQEKQTRLNEFEKMLF